LREIKNIEKEMGRAQDSFAVGGYIDRIIDIDIVLFGGVVVQSQLLEIPHKKHLLEGDFSKVLLEEIK
jgi:2-amino-4-hydroxy-6-hydroxymethyldihydropteridine diphosphokinase